MIQHTGTRSPPAPPQRGVLDDSGGISAVPIEPRLQALFVAFFRLGATAYREPAMMAYLRQECVGKRQWLTKQDFKEGMALCHTIPGATMM